MTVFDKRSKKLTKFKVTRKQQYTAAPSAPAPVPPPWDPHGDPPDYSGHFKGFPFDLN